MRKKKKKKIKNCNLDNAAICYKFEVSKNYKVMDTIVKYDFST